VQAAEDLLAPGGPLPPTDGLRYSLQGQARVVVRPSGTEPKVKCYLEVVEPVTGGDVDDARARAGRRMQTLRGQMSTLLA